MKVLLFPLVSSPSFLLTYISYAIHKSFLKILLECLVQYYSCKT